MTDKNTSTPATETQFEDLKDPITLRALFPIAEADEIRSIRKIASTIAVLKEFAVLSKGNTARILATINTEWREEIERSRKRITRSLYEKIRFVYKRGGVKGLRLQPLLVPVGIAAMLLLFGYVPEIAISFNDLAGTTLNSLSGAAGDNLGILGGFIAIVALGLVFLVFRNSNK